MYLLVVNSFLSAFLIFQIQPVIGKVLLPVFGGGASIWSATMLSFQLLLLAGYVYAYVLSKKVPEQWQRYVHGSLLIAALLVQAYLAIFEKSPIYPPTALAESFRDTPVGAIILLIACSVGIPYFVLSSNSTLMQVWLAKEGVADPYWMYAFSNAGSSLALLTYPFLIEPFFGVTMQGWIWSGMFLVFLVLSFFILSRFSAAEVGGEKQRKAVTFKLSPSLVLLWVILSFLPSMMLLAATAYTTQEVAPVPFLWIVPLFLYLLSFIIAFSSERAYNRYSARNFLFVACALYVVPALDLTAHISLDIIIVTTLFFLIAWFCHGELYRLRPAIEDMQLFYVFVALGGVLGGLSVSVLAPLVLDRHMEFYIGILLTWVLYGLLSYLSAQSFRAFASSAIFNRALFSYVVVGGTLAFIFYDTVFARKGFYERNFYGSKKVFLEKMEIGPESYYKLQHGTILHGKQNINPARRNLPTAYYGNNSGAGRAVRQLMSEKEFLNVGVIGLGVGTFAVFGREGDQYTFFEIDPAIKEIAEGKYKGTFSYLEDSKADVRVLIGDARITLEKLPSSDLFDLLVIDAFSSDSIPVHLLTVEAVKLYMSRLKPGGMVAIHISNQHLNLLKVVTNITHLLNLPAVYVLSYQNQFTQVDHANWVVVARDATTLAPIAETAKQKIIYPQTVVPEEQFRWTDDFSNLYSALFEPQIYPEPIREPVEKSANPENS